MKNLLRLFSLACLGTILSTGFVALRAQDGPPPGAPNFDPAQMRQRMMERYREQLKIKDDAEWKLIEERISKVADARMQMGFRGGPGGFGRGGRGPNGGGPNGGGPAAQGAPGGQGGPGGRRGFPGAEPSAEATDLQKALDADAPAAEVKTKLEKYRGSLKEKEAALTKAQDDLRQLLTVKQEAAAVLAGLLK